MFIIVGLGNPEPEYSKTRHNMGFDVINILSKKFSIDVNKSKFQSLYGTGNIGKEKVVLVKPQTYMNLSGEAIREVVSFYKEDMSNLIVICDDIDTAPGKIRIRKSGGPGTHNGMKSVVQCLGTENFARVRVGIGMPEFKGDLINYVIGSIPENDIEDLEKGTNLAELAVEAILTDGIDIAMNKYNA